MLKILRDMTHEEKAWDLAYEEGKKNKNNNREYITAS